MLYYIYSILFTKFSFLRIFRYITIRTAIAFIVSFFIVLVLGKPFINYLRKKDIGEEIRELGPQNHKGKAGTPTMGGLLILLSVILTTFISGDLTNKFTIVLMIITFLFGLLGFFDDYLKWSKKDKEGLKPKKKLFIQILICCLVSLFIIYYPLIDNKMNYSIVNPFIKNSHILIPGFIGLFIYFTFIFFVIIGTSNAVNITDGLDGLAIGPVIIVILILAVISYLSGNISWSKYLNLNYIRGSGEILVFLASVVGAGLGFLWYNFYPADIFMGDVGSLTLGGIIGTVSVFLKQELLLPIIGFVFIVEALSVIIQVGSFKLRKKRVFKMAPIHHHYELLGMSETKVTIRFWIIGLLFGIIGLIILKLR